MMVHKEYDSNCLIIKIVKLGNDICFESTVRKDDVAVSPDDKIDESFVGHIIGYIIERFAIIISLYVDPVHRGKGFGMKLMKEFLTKAYDLGVVHAELDDCSDNYRKDHNIYIKCGFTYTDSDNRMYANVRSSLSFTPLNKVC